MAKPHVHTFLGHFVHILHWNTQSPPVGVDLTTNQQENKIYMSVCDWMAPKRKDTKSILTVVWQLLWRPSGVERIAVQAEAT
jgi:hypothetical protein